MSGIIVYTNAPKAYDYSYVVDLADNVATCKGTDKTVRKVEIPRTSYQYQTDRYASGLCFALSESEFNKQVELNLLTPTPDLRVDYYRKTFDLRPLFSMPRATRLPISQMITCDPPILVKGDSMGLYTLTIKGDKAEFDKINQQIITALGDRPLDIDELAYLDQQAE